MNPFEAQPTADQPNVAPEQLSGASLLPAPPESPPATGPTYAPATELVPELPPLPEVKSDDGRVLITDTSVTVQGREFLLRELERADVAHVRWILWFLLGGLGLAFVMIVYLQNGLRTGPAMLGMALTGLLLAYGHRGTNRLRLHRLGREVVNFALPGETPPWQRLTAELNRRIFRVHDHAARQAAAELAAADEAMRLAAQQAAEAAAAGDSSGFTGPAVFEGRE
ncbi:hypothetical protein MON38_09645 [Hymenobacter sp. DH14]|uniref:Uncharacterized protein n=1 Tax=Hymenobacter cyanobacteriorum TaxID=2926463 RepID=A0A9X1VEH5_9BACT|nr:hypothetical protein [Hymenobacter cyanobacteriorum]MCI1187684.1 hypothetical protein [Hymenobacter cyanobacteriorum]